MIKVCFCPESLKWIMKHLRRNAKSKFRTMIKTGSITKIGKRIVKRHKKHFSQKQLAAQRLFSKRAKAGTLRRRR